MYFHPGFHSQNGDQILHHEQTNPSPDPQEVATTAPVQLVCEPKRVIFKHDRLHGGGQPGEENLDSLLG